MLLQCKIDTNLAEKVEALNHYNWFSLELKENTLSISQNNYSSKFAFELYESEIKRLKADLILLISLGTFSIDKAEIEDILELEKVFPFKDNPIVGYNIPISKSDWIHWGMSHKIYYLHDICKLSYGNIVSESSKEDEFNFILDEIAKANNLIK